MKLDAATHKRLHEPVEGFDGVSRYEHEGRHYAIVTTHGWGLKLPGKDEWVIPVCYHPLEPVEGEPVYMVMERSEFLAAFKEVPWDWEMYPPEKHGFEGWDMQWTTHPLPPRYRSRRHGTKEWTEGSPRQIMDREKAAKDDAEEAERIRLGIGLDD